MDPTAPPDLDAALRRLHEGAPGFARSSPSERLGLLRHLLEGYASIAPESVAAGCRMKGIPLDSPAAFEEWAAGPVVVVRNLRLLIETLRNLERGRPAIDPDRVRTRPDGRVVARVFPASALDRVLFGGITGEVWMRPGVAAGDVIARASSHYRVPVGARRGTVALVLGAGNVASIPPGDVLHKMFVEGKVCVLKMNPVNEYLGPFLERAFARATAQGLLSVAYGGPDVGAHLVEHPLVDEIHMTGSDATHDAIVWGPPGPEREARKARRQPRLAKVVTAELGNISPVIVVPGLYTAEEFGFQGDSIAAAITNNASFNCTAARLLVQARCWEGRRKLTESLAASLARTPARKAYYPGAEDRWKALSRRYVQAERYGDPRPGALPWTLIRDLDPADREDALFRREAWCPIIAETALGGDDPAAFLGEAVRFCNDQVWGTLSATLVVHPTSMRDPSVAQAVDKAIRDLRYGTVAVNQWPALGFAFGTTPWGGHPSSTPEDIQSGAGWVHNTIMLHEPDIEKCVIRGPLIVRPRPPWLPGHRTAHRLGRRLMEMEVSPSIRRLPGMILDALRG
jgi:aldehyde dehydrogenase (NAD(P)+)